MDYSIRQATENDLDAVELLLAACELPVVRVAPHIKTFLVAETDDKKLVGVLGMLADGDKALLRSFAVSSLQRKRGVGLALVRQMLAQLSEQHCTAAFLLTETAEQYFARLGFVVIERAAMPQALLVESGLDQACPCSSVCMQYKL